jgi:hypothetical protein
VGSQVVLVHGWGCHFTGLHTRWLTTLFFQVISLVIETIYSADILSDSWLFRQIILSITHGCFSGLYPQWLRTLAGFYPEWLKSLFRRVISSVTQDSVPPGYILTDSRFWPPGYILSDSGLFSAAFYPQWLRTSPGQCPRWLGTVFRLVMPSVVRDSGFPCNILSGTGLFRRVIAPATEDYFIGLYPQWLRSVVPQNTVSDSRPFRRVISTVVRDLSVG